MSISPTGYEYGITPRGNHPFWDNTGDITGVTASVTVDDTSGVPDAEVDAEYNEGVVNLAFAFTGLKGAKGDKGDTGAQGATGATGAKGDTGATPNVTATATVDSTSGTPSVEVTKTGTTDNPVLNFAFSNLKGDAGSNGSTPNVTATASVDGTSGTPNVTVTKSGTEAAPAFDFAFEGLKGTKGDTGDTPNVTATASVDNNTGTPSVSVTTTGTTDNPVLNFAFSNLKGATGAQGAQGVKGDTGDTGATGAQGLTGATPVISATATVDNTSGTPAVSVTKSGTDEAPNLAFAFTGLKGATGGTQSTIHGFWEDPVGSGQYINEKTGALTKLEISGTDANAQGGITITEQIEDGSTQETRIIGLPYYSQYNENRSIPLLSVSGSVAWVSWNGLSTILSAVSLAKTPADLYAYFFGSSYTYKKYILLPYVNQLSGDIDSGFLSAYELGGSSHFTDTFATAVLYNSYGDKIELIKNEYLYRYWDTNVVHDGFMVSLDGANYRLDYAKITVDSVEVVDNGDNTASFKLHFVIPTGAFLSVIDKNTSTSHAAINASDIRLSKTLIVNDITALYGGY